MLSFLSKIQENISAFGLIVIVLFIMLQFLIAVFVLELQAQQGFYFVGKDSSEVMKRKFRDLIGEHEAGPQEVEVVMGRKLQVCAGMSFAT